MSDAMAARAMAGDAIGVVGPGALGLALGATLQEGGASVVVLDHDRARAARLAGGIRVRGPGSRPERDIPLKVTSDPAALAPVATILVCVKAHADEAAVRLLAGVRRDAAIVTLGNGLGRGEALAALGKKRILVGTTAEGATLEAEGLVRHAGRGLTLIAPLSGEARDLARRTVARLAAHGLDARLADDARRLVWEKVQVNAAINALAGLLDCPNGRLLESRHARALALEAAVECARVARALGVSGTWTDEVARERWESVAAATSVNLCSTVQDLRRRRKSEIHAINGAIARAGREAGVATPLNEHLAALIGAREELSQAVTPPSA